GRPGRVSRRPRRSALQPAPPPRDTGRRVARAGRRPRASTPSGSRTGSSRRPSRGRGRVEKSPPPRNHAASESARRVPPYVLSVLPMDRSTTLRELWDTTRLRLLVEIERSRSVSAAEQAIGIGQPEASQHLRLLETPPG